MHSGISLPIFICYSKGCVLSRFIYLEILPLMIRPYAITMTGMTERGNSTITQTFCRNNLSIKKGKYHFIGSFPWGEGVAVYYILIFWVETATQTYLGEKDGWGMQYTTKPGVSCANYNCMSKTEVKYSTIHEYVKRYKLPTTQTIEEF